MKHEKSCGAVVFTRDFGEVRYLLVANKSGVYGFPKGHVEAGETEVQTALREIREEVGLNVRLIEDFRTEDEHPLPEKPDVIKHIVYFLGEYGAQRPVRQEAELSKIELLPYEEAMGRFRFESHRRILREANDFLKE